MKIIKMQKPTHKSSNVDTAGFSEVENGRGKLRVLFLDGTLYEYDDVPQAIFNALMSDKSPGGFLHKQVIGHFKHRKIENLRYELRLEIHEVEGAPASSLQAGNVDSPDPWSLGTFGKLKDALAYRNGMTIMAEVVNENLQASKDSATAETPAPASLAQS